MSNRTETNWSEHGTREQPAIGILDTGDGDAVAGTILRAREGGYHTLVLTRRGDSEAARFARELGAEVLTPEERTTNGNKTKLLGRIARKQGFPGVIYHADPTHRIDYEQSTHALWESDDYVISSYIDSEDGAESGIVVGIPAYNEEVGIGSAVHGAAEVADEVVVVDDGSEDRTAEIARNAGAKVLSHESNRGKGAAIQTFLSYASAESFDVAVLLDGDGQHIPKEIPRVVEPIQENDADVVIGSRYLESGEDETPRYRRVGQKILDVLTLGTSGRNVTDSQSGFRALSPEAVEKLNLTTDGIGIESEMISSATNNGLTIEEVPIDVRYEGIDGQTYNPLHHGLGVVTFILTLMRDRHPLLFFGIPGVILMTAGGLWGIDAILVYQSTGTFYPAKVLVSGFATIIGSVGIFAGLILNRISNMIHESEVGY